MRAFPRSVIPMPCGRQSPCQAEFSSTHCPKKLYTIKDPVFLFANTTVSKSSFFFIEIGTKKMPGTRKIMAQRASTWPSTRRAHRCRLCRPSAERARVGVVDGETVAEEVPRQRGLSRSRRRRPSRGEAGSKIRADQIRLRNC